MRRRNLRGRLDRLEKQTQPEGWSITVIATEEDRRKAEARRKAALARGQPIIRITVAGIDLRDGI